MEIVSSTVDRVGLVGQVGRVGPVGELGQVGRVGSRKDEGRRSVARRVALRSRW